MTARPESPDAPEPIPPSFYSGGSEVPSGPASPPPGDSRPKTGLLRQIPGFRTGTRWKQVVGALGYLVIVAWIVQFPTNPPLGVLGLLFLCAIWLAANAFGFRTRVPVFRSSSRWAAGGAWAALGTAMLITGALAAAPSSTPDNGVGSGPSALSTDAAVGIARSPSTASPSAVSSPPSPSLKPSPTPSPSPPPPPTSVAAPQPAPPPPPAFDYCGAPSNPWHYNFCASNSGKYIYSPPNPTFCQYFNCITSFWKSANGYVVECNDGAYSHSGGVQGACSYHNGVMRALWD